MRRVFPLWAVLTLAAAAASAQTTNRLTAPVRSAGAVTRGAALPAATAAPGVSSLPPLPEGSVDDIQENGELTIITADKLTYDAQKGYAMFERNVIVSDPNMKMKTDKLTVRFTEKNDVTSIVADGRVIMSQADKRAWAGKATYDLVSGEILLEGDPRVMRGRDMLLGKTITFWRDQNRMICYPEARLIIYPEKDGAGTFMSKGK